MFYVNSKRGDNLQHIVVQKAVAKLPRQQTLWVLQVCKKIYLNLIVFILTVKSYFGYGAF